jgi:hypothetical protein
LLWSTWKSLPWKWTFQKVKQNMTDSL